MQPDSAPADGTISKRESTVAPSERGTIVQPRASTAQRYSTRKSSAGIAGIPAELPADDDPEEPPSDAAGGGGAAAGDGDMLMDDVNLLQPPLPSSALTMGVREYLEKEIVPTLLPALAALCEERPPAPVQYLAHYLLEKSYQNNPKS